MASAAPDNSLLFLFIIVGVFLLLYGFTPTGLVTSKLPPQANLILGVVIIICAVFAYVFFNMPAEMAKK